MQDPFTEVKEHFSQVDRVTVNAGKGAQGMKYGGKMFVMFFKGQLIVQLPPARVNELIASGEGLPHDPGTGKPMKNRLIIPDTEKEKWIAFCEESLRHVSGM